MVILSIADSDRCSVNCFFQVNQDFWCLCLPFKKFLFKLNHVGYRPTDYIGHELYHDEKTANIARNMLSPLYECSPLQSHRSSAFANASCVQKAEILLL